MMLRWGRLVIAAAMAVAASDHAGAQTAVQHQFDEASRAFDAGNWRAAANLFSVLRTKLGLGSRAAAVADIREGYSRLRLGDRQLAISLLESGLERLPDEPTLQADKLLAVQGLANGYEASNDVLLSASYYREEMKLAPDDPTKRAAYAGFARTVMFEEPSEAIKIAGMLFSMAHETHERAVALDLMGRAQLEAGQHAAAIETFRRAVRESGGLTQRIDQLDDAIRADMALAGLLSGNDKLAHLYLSATGAAQDRGSFLPVPNELGARRCPENASPEDVAIVEFGLTAEGHTKDVRPIYASGGGEFAGIMARYVSDFRWDPLSIAQLRPLQASMARIEVHCFNDDPTVTHLYENADPWRPWLISIGLVPYEARSRSASAKLAKAKEELANRERIYGRASIRLFPVLRAIEDSPLTGTPDSIELLTRQIEIARTAKAPPSVLASLEADRATAGIIDEDVQLARLRSLVADPTYRQDPEASAYLKWLIGQLLSRGGKPADELRQVADTNSLPASHPIRRAANLRLAEYDFSKRSPARKERVRASGLTFNPCSAAEVQRTTQASSRGYPELTRHWGFEGWTFLRSDIDSDGRVRNVVPMIAYPPMIFTRAANATASQMRYNVADALVPGIGCTGYITSVRFHLEP